MLTILKHKQNDIYYKCSCGTQGMCFIKPVYDCKTLVVYVKCPTCGETERVTLLSYDSEEHKNDLINNTENGDLAWVPTFNQ